MSELDDVSARIGGVRDSIRELEVLRNRLIVEEHSNGASISSLAKRTGLSRQRIYQIFNQYIFEHLANREKLANLEWAASHDPEFSEELAAYQAEIRSGLEKHDP